MTPRILWFLLVASSFLRRFVPFLRIGKRVIVTRNKDVLDILSRDRDFTISQINGPTIDELSGPFILAMDCPAYAKDAASLRRAVHRNDPKAIATLVTDHAEALVEKTKPTGRIDVIAHLADVVPLRLVEEYFGIPMPDRKDEQMRAWMRVLFNGVFLNVFNNKATHQAALDKKDEFAKYLDQVIAERSAPQRPAKDDFLGRLIEIRARDKSIPAPEEDSWVRRNISGMVLGAIVTTSKTVALIMDQLLKHPSALIAASKAAGTKDGDASDQDMELLRQICYEALRFNPHNPILIRHCVRDSTVGVGMGAYHFKAGATVYAVALSAMMDSSNFPDPKTFSTNRPRSRYLHFGYGLHSCFGEFINQISLPRIIAPLVRLKNLRRESGPEGVLQFDGPFPSRMILRFDP